MYIHAKFLGSGLKFFQDIPERKNLTECVYKESDCLINGKMAFDNITTKGCLYYKDRNWYISFQYNTNEIGTIGNWVYKFHQAEDSKNSDLPPSLWIYSYHNKTPMIALEIFHTGDNIKG